MHLFQDFIELIKPPRSYFEVDMEPSLEQVAQAMAE
jgi:hypothetical protein